MAQHTTDSNRVPAFREPMQQLQTQVSHWRVLRITAALLGVAAFAALGGGALKAQTASFTAAQRTLGSGFLGPADVAVDSAGNLFVADQQNNAVKEILAAGGYTTINTLAVANGNFVMPTGVAVDGSGNVFVADFGNTVVKEILATGGYTTVNTLGTVSSFTNPTGVALDANGNVFVVDQANTLKEILAAGGYLTVNTLAVANGNFNEPSDVAVDGSGNVFVTNFGTSTVEEVLAPGYTAVAIVGSGFDRPNGVAVDTGGNVYVADTLHHAIKEILAAGGYTTVNTLSTGFTQPNGVAVGASGIVYVADVTDTGIVEVQPNGVNFGAVDVGATSFMLSLTFTFTTAGSGITEAVSTQGATGLDFTDAGTGTCHTNTSSHAYAIGGTCTIDVTFTSTAAGLRYGAAQLKNSSSVVIATGYVYGTGVAGQARMTPGLFTTVAGMVGSYCSGATAPCGDGGLATSADLYTPEGVLLDATGKIYIADTRDNRIRLVDPTNGNITTAIGTGDLCAPTTGSCGDAAAASGAHLNFPSGVAMDGAGNLYIADLGDNRIRMVSASTGVISTVAGTGSQCTPTTAACGDGFAATTSHLSNPSSVAVDGSGNLYIADNDDNRIRKVTASTGLISTVAGTGAACSSPTATCGDGFAATTAQLDDPIGVAVDGAGNLYIANTYLHRIRKVTAATGIITTVAGTGAQCATTTAPAACGDGAAAVSAQLYYPQSVGVDAAGDLYIGDTYDNRVRRVSAATGIITTVAGAGTGSSSDLYRPYGLAFASNGDLYVADAYNYVIRKVPAGSGIATFGSYAEGVSSPPLDVTLSNSGNAALDLSAVTASTNFNLQGSDTTCSSSSVIAPGSDCILGIEFLPTAGGSLSGSVTLAPAASNVAAPGVLLSGTGVAPVAAQLALGPVATTLAAGGNLGTVAVSVESSGGIVVTTSTASITVTVSGPGGYSQTVTGTAASGVASLNLSSLVFTTSGTYTATASSAALTSAIATVTVTAGAASQLVNSAAPPAVASGGNLGTLVVTIKDAFGNVVTTSSAVVTVTITGPGGYSHFVTGAAAGGVASLNLSSLVFTTAGTYTVTTTSGSLSGVQTFVVAAIATTTALTSSAAVVVAGASVTLTATISPVPTGSPLGTVNLYSGGVLLGSGSIAVNPSGVATYTTSSLATGPDTITAVFSGNAGYSTSTSAAISVQVNSANATATTSVLTEAPNPVIAGHSATFTVTISPAPTGLPLGAVSFRNGGTLLGAGSVNGSGVATFSTTTLPVGSDSITASYSGNAGFAGSTSTAVSVQVNPANGTATVTGLTSSNLAPTYGQSVILTATVTPAPNAAPPGTVSFYAGTTLLGTQAVNAQGIATLSLSLPLGPNSIMAAYSGSAGFTASTSSPLSVSARALSAIAFSASPTTQLATMPVVFTALVNSATPGVQTGTISFLNGSTVMATVAIVPGQPTVYSETSLSSGAYSVTASYSGDGSFLPGASTGAPVSITVSDLNLAIGGDKNKTVVPGGAVTYNFPLSPVLTPTFLYNVALTATGLPPGATYAFSPASIPAGSGTLPVAFTVQTATTTGMLASSRGPWLALVFGLLLPLAGAKRFRARVPRMLLLFGALSLGLVAGLGGCGSGGFLGTPPGQTSYTITILATSGTLVRTTTVQLNFE